MASLVISVAVGVLTFGVGLLGLYLKRLVPERHMSAGSRDMIGAVIGLLSLLLALVLGTLVGSAYGALAFGSFAVASAIFLILELNQPFTGLFRIPSEPIERAIAALGSSPG